MHRPATITGAWGYLPDAASGSLAELVTSLATSLAHQAQSLLDSDRIPSVATVSQAIDHSAALTLRTQRLEAKAKNLNLENSGLRRLAARAEMKGETARVANLQQDEAENDERLNEIERGWRPSATSSRPLTTTARTPCRAKLNLLAYLVAVLERSAAVQGVGTERAGRLCDRTFTTWRFGSDDQGLWWTCNATFPLQSGDTASLPLNGHILNLRDSPEAQRAQVVEYIFERGRRLTKSQPTSAASAEPSTTATSCPGCVITASQRPARSAHW